MINKVIGLLVVLIIIISNVNARIHKLEIQGDSRRYIALTTFGFYQGGLLSVKMTNFRMSNFDENAVYGFSLDRTLSDDMNPYLDRHQEKCPLTDLPYEFLLDPMDESSVIYLTMDFKKNLIKVSCSQNMKSVHIYSEIQSSQMNHSSMTSRNKEDPYSYKMQDVNEEQDICSNINLPIDVKTIDNVKYFNTTFHIYVDNEDGAGLYKLIFYSCPNYNYKDQTYIDFTMNIQESNGLNFLSAGEMPLPSLYFMMSILFFTSGCTWIYVLKKSQHPVFQIHYLMAVLVFLKSLSLLFHGIDFHFIETKGEHVAAWAFLYFVTHFVKEIVLLITIVFIGTGTGWNFKKHFLAGKDNKIFMIVISLQTLANVAEVLIEESEEGDIEHKTWKDVLTLVDLLCCGAILFPVACSIKHLQKSANTDGKTEINLQKIKLIRHFYIMIVLYIYFTRIIVYLLQITVSFQYEWIDELFCEMATFIFFALTGYKFRPALANPYFTVNDDLPLNDDDDKMDVV